MSTPAYERNRQPVSRQDFYKIACDPRRHVAVEACAGAGKTWMLVSRILRALLEGTEPQEILAITFTKKAAGEMRQRLMEWLEEFAHADDATLREQLLIRGVDAAQAPALVEPLRTLYARLLAQGRTVPIRTFHSWFAALLRNAPFSVLEELGLPTAYELLENDAQAVELVWRPFQARLLRDPEARRDYEALIATHGRSQTESALAAALARRVEFALADAAGVLEASVPAAAALYKEFTGLATPAAALSEPAVRARWLERARALGQERNKTPQKAAAAVIDAYALLDQADAAEQTLARLRAAFFVKDEDRLTQHLQKLEAAQAAEPELQRLCAAQQQHEAWVYQQRMTRLARLLVDVYAELKRERGWVDMNDVERAALRLLADPVLGGWVQERLDARTRHLLIDEFQDTNPLQWQALHAWLSGYAGSGGGAQAPSLFIVGDPKQSIYRFRRAEPQVFRAAKDFVRELGGELLSCDHTRRNATAVLGLVNEVMGQAQGQGEYEDFRVHTTESEEAGAVLALPQIPRPERQDAGEDEGDAGWRDSLTVPRVTPEERLHTLECRQAARWIAVQLSAGLHPRDVMVLARKRERLALMQDELRELGIPAQQPEKTDLGEAPEVQDLVALLDALVSPAHDLSLARALKSPLFGVTDEALIELALRQRTQRRPWFELLQGAGWSGSLQHVGPTLLRWKQWVDTLPPHDALDAIYEDGDVLARFVAAAPQTSRAGVLVHLQALLAAALQVDGARYATPYAFVRALKAGGVAAPTLADADAVRLLTVHGAKGLEAPLVLLLDTDAPAPRAQTMSVLLDWPGEAEAPRRFVFLASESRLPPSAREAMDAERQERQREELNALYVALTRAQRRLALSAVQPHRGSEGSWWLRLQALCQPAEVSADPPVRPARASQEAVAITLPVLPTIDATGSLRKSAVVAPPTPDALIGQTMHRLLEWAPLDAQDWSAEQVQRAASEFGLDAAQARQAAAMVLRILQGQGAWAWRSAEIAWQGNEVPVTVQGSVRRIDRLVRRTDGSWWVLDYKSAAQPQARDELSGQLRDYRAAVQAACPGESVRAAFLSASGGMEEVE